VLVLVVVLVLGVALAVAVALGVGVAVLFPLVLAFAFVPLGVREKISDSSAFRYSLVRCVLRSVWSSATSDGICAASLLTPGAGASSFSTHVVPPVVAIAVAAVAAGL
jgi:hypothetical protein